MEQEDVFKVGWAGVVYNKRHEEREAGEGTESISPCCLGGLDTAPRVETAPNAPQLGTKMLGPGSAVLQGAGPCRQTGHSTAEEKSVPSTPRCTPDKEMLRFAPSYQQSPVTATFSSAAQDQITNKAPLLAGQDASFNRKQFYLALMLLLLQEPSGAEAPRSPRPFSPRWKRGRYFFRRVTSLWHQLPHVLQRSLAVCSVCMQALIIFLASGGIKSSDKN